MSTQCIAFNPSSILVLPAADLEGRLELAAAEVAQMREAVGQMGQRLEARDKAVAAQLQVSISCVEFAVARCSAGDYLQAAVDGLF